MHIFFLNVKLHIFDFLRYQYYFCYTHFYFLFSVRFTNYDKCYSFNSLLNLLSQIEKLRLNLSQNVILYALIKYDVFKCIYMN